VFIEPLQLNRPVALEMGPLDPNRLALFTPRQLRLLRNAFFAEKGYEFQSEDLQRIFGRYDWYEPGGFVDDFTDVQRQNIRAIQEMEARRSGPD
jgi:hypothetical protein